MKLIRIVSMLILGILLAACSASAAEPTETLAPTATLEPPTATVEASPPPTTEAGTPLLTVFRHGGMCVTGGECQFTMSIATDGSVAINDGGGEVILGALPADQLAELQTLIAQTDFAAIKAVPFTDTCPTAYDGQEIVYTFATDHGSEELASCQYAIDTTLPLFAWVDQRMSEVTPRE